MRLRDTLHSGVLNIIGGLSAAGRGSLAEHSMLETAIDLNEEQAPMFYTAAQRAKARYSNANTSIVTCKDGSIYTMIRFSGSRKIVGPTELSYIIKNISSSLHATMDNPGHAIEIYFSRNPDDSAALVNKLLNVQRNVAESISLSLPDIFKEDEHFLPKWLAKEDIYFVLWTRSSIFSKEELKHIAAENAEESGKTPWGFMIPKAIDIQNPYSASKQIITRHMAFCRSFMDASHDAGMVFNVMTAHETIKAVRTSIYPETAEGSWSPTLPGDVSTSSHGDSQQHLTKWLRLNARDPLSAALWPKLDEQIFTEEAEYINSQICRIGGNYFSTIDFLGPPEEMVSFQHLLYRVMRQDAGREFPWRFSMKIEGDGLAGTNIPNMLSSILSITTPDGWNSSIHGAITSLREMRKNNVSIVRVRMSATTWSPVSAGLQNIERRLLSLTKAVEGWGKSRVGASSGDPIASTLGTVAGLSLSSTAPSGAAPLSDILLFFPWARDVSPWASGGSVFRSADGRVFPVELGGKQRTTWNDIIIAPPGHGKSVWLATTNLASCLSPRTTEGYGGPDIPFISGLDIGQSQEGFYSIIREGLPAERRHEVLFKSMRMREDCAINPFDTPLGCRKPITTHKESLEDFLCLLVENDDGTLPPHMADMISVIVSEIYTYYSDKERRNNQPKRYERGRNRLVDEAIERYNIDTSVHRYWYSIVDVLSMEHGEHHLASIAQRYAVPELRDLIPFNSENIKQYREVRVGETSQDIISSFKLRIEAAVTKYAILSCPTQLDVSQAKIAILDIKDICGQSGSQAANKQTSVAYSLGMIAICSSLYQKTTEIDEFNPDYYKYHFDRLTRIQEVPKRLIFDEYHVTAGSPRIRIQTERYMRTGRKYNIMLAIASQIFADFDENMLKLASGIWIMGCEDRERADLKARLDLSPSAIDHLERHLNGPDSTGAPFLALLNMAGSGRHEHFLKNTIGPIKTWAFSTTAEDTSLRSRLYSRMSPAAARSALAQRFPRGSAVAEITQRINEKASQDKSIILSPADKEKAKSSVIEEMAEEVFNIWVLGNRLEAEYENSL